MSISKLQKCLEHVTNFCRKFMQDFLKEGKKMAMTFKAKHNF